MKRLQKYNKLSQAVQKDIPFFLMCQIINNTGMQACKLNDVKKHGDWYPLALKMDSDCNICFVVWGCPSIRCKAQSTHMFLYLRGEFLKIS